MTDGRRPVGGRAYPRSLRALAVIAVLLVGGLSSAQAGVTGPWPPQTYRFTGWMSTGVGYAPHHAFVEGDTVVLHFQDAANERPTPCRVVWSRPNGTNRKCWSRIARSFRISSIETAGPLLHFGSYISRWYVGRQVVASWPFLFDKEIITTHP